MLPEHLRPALDVVDEVWVGSDYVRSLIAPVTEKPVLVMPVPIRVPSPPSLPREQLGLPDGFLFFFMFDFFSSIERKNPLGLIEAYRRAFGPDDGAALVLKSVNGETRLEELELLRAAAGRSARHRHHRPLRLGRRAGRHDGWRATATHRCTAVKDSA